jgi:hypothetical protein
MFFGYSLGIAALLTTMLAYGQSKDAIPALQHFPLTVRVSLSKQAANMLNERKETLIIAATYDGVPTTAAKAAAKAKKVPLDDVTGDVDLGRESIELTKPGDGILTGAKIKRPHLSYVQGQEVHVNINVVSGRRSSKNNLLNCGIFDGLAKTTTGKPISIQCKTMGER